MPNHGPASLRPPVSQILYSSTWNCAKVEIYILSKNRCNAEIDLPKPLPSQTELANLEGFTAPVLGVCLFFIPGLLPTHRFSVSYFNVFGPTHRRSLPRVRTAASTRCAASFDRCSWAAHWLMRVRRLASSVCSDGARTWQLCPRETRATCPSAGTCCTPFWPLGPPPRHVFVGCSAGGGGDGEKKGIKVGQNAERVAEMEISAVR